VLAFIFAESLLLIAAGLNGDAASFFSPSLWARSDSGIYLQIAAHGYNLTRCTGSTFPPHSWCGDAGWAPLYPWLLSLSGHAGISLPVAGLALSALFAFLTLLCMWLLIGPDWSLPALSCLALAACFPGMVFDYSLFPVSLASFLSIAFLLLLVRRRYLISGLAGAVCAWTFPTGLLMAPVAFLAVLLGDRGRSFGSWLSRTVRSAGVAAAGAGALFVAFQVWVGNWSAYLAVQSKYGNGLSNPFATFVAAFSGAAPAPYPVQGPNPGYNYLVPEAQTAFVAAIVILTVVMALIHRPVGAVSSALVVYTLAVWFVPLLDGPSLSRYRVEALLVPCAALFLRLPRVVQVGAVVIAAVLAVGLASLFIQNRLG
jgi:hypothetical protein